MAADASTYPSPRPGRNSSLADRDGFAASYAALRPAVVAAADRVLRNHAAAEEVAQDIFLGLLRNPSKFDPSRGSLRVFVCMLARSRALDRLRTEASRRRSVERLAALGRAEIETRDDRVEPDEHLSLLSAVHALPRAQRETIILAYGAGLTNVQVSTVLGIPLGTAKSRLRTGLEGLRNAHNLEDALGHA